MSDPGGAYRRILRRKRWRDLWRRRTQVIAVAATVFLGVGLYVAVYNAYLGLRDSYDATYDRLDFPDVWLVGGDSAKLRNAVAAMPNVSDVLVRPVIDVPVRIKGRHSLVGRFIGIPTEPARIAKLMKVSGALPKAGANAAIENHGAKHFELRAGDQVEVMRNGAWAPVRLSGAMISAEYLWVMRDKSDIVTNPDDFTVFFAPSAFVRSLAAKVPEQVLVRVAGHDRDAIAAIKKRGIELGAIDAYGRDGQPSNATLQNDVTGFAALSFLFPLLFLGVAGMATSVLLSRMIAMQRSEIGMLVASGYSPRAVFAHFTGHGLLVALLGGLPGLGVGLLVGNWMTDGYAAFLDIPVVSHSTSPMTLGVGLLFVVLTGLIAGGMPAWRAARTTPADAMRPVAPTGGGRHALFERLVPGRWRKPGAVMVVRNLVRHRRRSLSTVLGVILSAVLILVALGLQDSIQGSIGKHFGKIDRRDISLRLNQPVTRERLTQLEAVTGVARAEPTLSVGAVVQNQAKGSRALVRIDVYARDTKVHEFAKTGFGDGLVLHKKTAAALGVRRGDTVFVGTRAGFIGSLKVAGVHRETFTALAYADFASWKAAGGPAANGVAITLTKDADARTLRRRLDRRAEVVASVDHHALRKQIDQMLGVALLFVGIMVVFGVVMAVALVFNAMSVSIAERYGEVATLQANGVPQSWIRRTITAENLLIVLAGIIPGLLAGYWVSSQFLAQFDQEGMAFPLDLSARSYLIAIGVLVGSALLAQIPGLRKLGRLDLPATVRERSA